MLKREIWVDCWRGILIIQIVLFHSIGVFANNSEGVNHNVLVFAGNYLAQYHVSSFLLLAGFVWRPPDTLWGFLQKRISRLLVPYFIFGFAWATLFCLMGSYFIANHSEYSPASSVNMRWVTYYVSVLLSNGYPNGIGYRIINTLWFLPAMFCAGVAFLFVDKCPRNIWARIICLLAMFVLWLKVRWLQLPWGLSELPKFVVFMMIGSGLRASKILTVISKKKNMRVVIVVILFGVLAVTGLINTDCVAFGMGDISMFAVIIVRGCIGGLATALLAQIIECRWLGLVGYSSLGILVLHKFAIIAFQSMPGGVSLLARLWVPWALTSLAVLTIAVVIASCAATSVIRRLCPLVLGEKRKWVDNDSKREQL